MDLRVRPLRPDGLRRSILRKLFRTKSLADFFAGDFITSMNRSKLSTRDCATRLSIFLFAVLLCQPIARGQNSGANGRYPQRSTRYAWARTPYNRHTWDKPSGPLPAPGRLLPHAGDYVSTETNYFEIVYMPLQTRIYPYDYKFRPISAQNIHATMSLQLPTEPIVRKIPFQYVPQPAGATEQDYLAASIDIRPLQNQEASITFRFTDLPKGNNTTEVFTPHYEHFTIRPYLTQAALIDADKEAIARQRSLPGERSSLGEPRASS